MLFLAPSHRSSGPAGPAWAPPGWGSCVLSTVLLLILPAAKCERASVKRAERRPSSRSGKVHTKCMFFPQHLASSLQGRRLIIYLPRKSCIMHVHAPACICCCVEGDGDSEGLLCSARSFGDQKGPVFLWTTCPLSFYLL